MAIRVDVRTSASLLGTVLTALSGPLAVLAVVALVYREPIVPFVVPAVVSLVVGFGLSRFERTDPGPREAFLLVALAWLSVALVGAIPFVLAGTGSFANPVNALLESMSGITTTGATGILAFTGHARSLLLWRSVLQWLGGLGILVFAVSLLSGLSVSGAQLMETETQTRDVTKLTPRITHTARILGVLYTGLTSLLVVVLLALHFTGFAPRMTLYNALAHALTTVSTAGFSPEAESVGAFSPVVQWVVTAFMFVGATNFVVLYMLTQGDVSRLRDSEEFRFYLGIVVAVAALLAIVLAINDEFATTEATLRHALFQVVSIVTTTGYATTDFDVWSTGARYLLFLGMFVGGMAGSTTCSIKTVRWLVVVKAFRRDLFTAIHPSAVVPIRLSGRPVEESAVRDSVVFVLASVVIVGAFTVFVVADAARTGTDLGEFAAVGAAASTFLNVGPAFGFAGPFGSYANFPETTKLVMTVLMWIGRIEIVPVLVLFTPSFWRS